MNYLFIGILGFIALISSTISVAGLRWWALQRKLLDIPNGRSSHTHPTPRGGGLAIVAISLFFPIGYALISPFISLAYLIFYLGGALTIATVSWFDDIKSLPSLIRLGTHSVGAILTLWGFGFWADLALPLPFFAHLPLNLLGLPFTFLWVVGLTNAYNFMDGIDGLAGGQAVLTGLSWAIIGGLSNQPLFTVLGLLIAMSSLGFLSHNWPPARIFMGDVGSAFLGYTFAVLPLIFNHLSVPDQGRSFLLGFLPLWPFIFDTCFTFLRRLRKGENVLLPHRSHLYQRLVIAGYSHRSVTLLYLSLSLFGILLALAWFWKLSGSAILIAIGIPLACFRLSKFVIQAERNHTLPKL